MFEIEKTVYGKSGGSTFYFRQSTFDKHLIIDIVRCQIENEAYDEIVEGRKKQDLLISIY